MGSFVEALFSACIAGALVWFVVRRGNTGGGNASTTAEIDRLRAVVEELSASLERRAEAAEQRLGKVINEAQAVQSVLDRALTAVGAQMVRQEAAPEPAPTLAAIAAPVVTEPVSTPTVAVVEPSPVRSVATEPIVEPESPAPSIPVPTASAPPSDLLHVPPTPPEAARRPEQVVRAVQPTLEENAAADGFAVQPIVAAPHPALTAETSEPERPTEPIAASTSPAAAEPVTTPVEPPIVDRTPAPLPPSRPASGGRDPKETAEREARVMSLVARGITNSVDIVRQTGLTRGEVELILTLHNLHIAPGPPVPPPSAIPEPEPEPVAAGAQAAAPVDAGIRPLSAPVTSTSAPAPGQDDRYAAIYALIAAGITDSVEIARRTGLGRGEVELHMGLHARNVL